MNTHFPPVTSTSSFIHLTMGFGAPNTLHLSTASEPSTRVRFSGPSVISGGIAVQTHKQILIINLSEHFIY